MQELVEKLTNELKERGMTLAIAESCTGGMVATAITALPGSSSVFDRGFVTYSYESKEDLLNVSREILETHGAVSHECAAAMAQGVLTHSRASLALSITGIAGPGGGMPGKPVGLVYIGWGLRNGVIETTEHHFSGDRASVRQQSAEAALRHALACLQEVHA
jgi:nicotinamide-nucleotide amidase